MATCAECVHVEVCSEKNLHVAVGMNITPRFKYKRIEQECDHFKDRSRFVELPCAEWIEDEDMYGDPIYRCSNCNEHFVLEEGTPTDNCYSYCPNCGAKMDEQALRKRDLNGGNKKERTKRSAQMISFDENWMTPKGAISESSQNSNTNHIKALLMVQKDIVQLVLNDREKLIVNYCICKEYRQNAVAKMLEVEPSTINKTLKNALRKMRRYIIICDKVLTYYEKECEKYEEI